MTNYSLPTYNFIWLALHFVSDSTTTQLYPQLLNVKISCMQIAQNQTFDVQLSISTIKSSVRFFSDILFIRSYANSITRFPSVVWCSRSISAMVTPTVFQIDILKYQNVCFSSSLDPLDIKRYKQERKNCQKIIQIVNCVQKSESKSIYKLNKTLISSKHTFLIQITRNSYIHQQHSKKLKQQPERKNQMRCLVIYLTYCGVRANFDFNKCLCNNCA
ncbi:Hypothetical_protein [Hexamita inflata]|uniref:Hypothetical_protein n=1 Tax=Hexamita inflata TaxID=28002 RepID=A0AA86VFG1_9EUKA|nr:Hypothetical protein HINF_LOCUS52848 [Hexamita inflata]